MVRQPAAVRIKHMIHRIQGSYFIMCDFRHFCLSSYHIHTVEHQPRKYIENYNFMKHNDIN
jgi:hypothetical protein